MYIDASLLFVSALSYNWSTLKIPLLSVKKGDTTERVMKDAIGRRYVRNGLTEKMTKFVAAYCGRANGVASEAFKMAGYKWTSPSSLYSGALNVRNHPLVKEAIEKRVGTKKEIYDLKADYLINKLIEVIEGEDKTADRLRAIELAGKAIALWKERQEISGPDGEAIKLEQERKENVADFTRRIAGLAERGTAPNVVELPIGRREG